MRKTKYTREVLEPIVKASKSLGEVIHKLGLAATGGNYRHISMRIRRCGVDTSHFQRGTPARRIASVSTPELELLVRESASLAQVLARLNLPTEGRPHHELSRRLQSLEISTSHFTGSGWARGQSYKTNESLARVRTKNRFKDEDVFIENSPLYLGAGIVPRLLARGWTYACAWCGVSEWRGAKLVLHLDHANGIHNDNRLENLRLLCPNCHSQTPTYSNRRRE